MLSLDSGLLWEVPRSVFENNRKSRLSVDLWTNLKTSMCLVSGSWKLFLENHPSLFFLFFFSDTGDVEVMEEADEARTF